jgi:hypothetical protein
MSILSWGETLIESAIDGTALTAAARASMLPAVAQFTLPPNFFNRVGKKLRIVASGRISCVVTTPGTARYDVNFLDSAAVNAIVADTQAMNLNIVAKTNVGWLLEMLLTCRATGTAANLLMQGMWHSEATVGSPLPTAGGSGAFVVPYNAAPAVGANFDSTLSQKVDLRFTQTVATGSMTCHQYHLEALN